MVPVPVIQLQYCSNKQYVANDKILGLSSLKGLSNDKSFVAHFIAFVFKILQKWFENLKKNAIRNRLPESH